MCVFMAGLLLFIAVFIAASGLLSMLDAAFLSVSRAEVEETVVHNLWGGQTLARISQRQLRAVIVIVIFTNIVNVLGPILIGLRAAHLFGNDAVGVITALLTALTIVFSEIIPKAMGTRYAPTISRWGAPFLYAIVLLLTPILALFEHAISPLRRGDRPVGTEEQIRALARLGEKHGFIEEDERRMIYRTFVLNDRRASDLMVPRSKIVGIASTSTIEDGARIASLAPHYRYPVYREKLDDIIGFVLARDLLQAFVEGRGNQSIQAIMREPLIVPSTVRADELLELFRRKRLHLAAVRTEQQPVLGVVTLHDVLEELVGTMDEKPMER